MHELMEVLSLKQSMAAILNWKKKVCFLLKYERAHPNEPLCKMSCLYDKMHTLSRILYESAGLICTKYAQEVITCKQSIVESYLNI